MASTRRHLPLQEPLAPSMQENLLTLLAYDKEHALAIRNTVDHNLFEGPYRTIAQKIYQHLDEYKRPPGDHIVDLFEDTLTKGDRKARQFGQLFQAIRESREEVDPK